LADVDALIAQLTLEEKASLTAGDGIFSIGGVERLGLPRVRVTDGPAGAKWLSGIGVGGAPSTWIPCESAIGATWDPELAERLGGLVASEALDRGCRGLLAPTVNLHRSALAGRDFECFSEDPLLTGRLAVGYVRGAQAKGVFATVKHFVGNEAETERTTMSSVIDERTLREIYLLPFELAVKEGRALAIMTSYNRLNGRWVNEQPELLLEVLRQEWGFEGLVMTDWHATVSPTASLAAGLDLEMPGPGRALGDRAADSVRSGSLDEADLDAAVRRLLTALDRAGALDAPTPPVAPEAPDAAAVLLVRSAAAEATVLLKNDGILPLAPDTARVAVIGELAGRSSMGGGGSAQLIPHRYASPVDAIRTALAGRAGVTFARGCDINRAPARVGGPGLVAPAGFTLEVYEGTDTSATPYSSRRLEDLFFVYNPTFIAEGYPEGSWSALAKGVVMPDSTGTKRLVLTNSSPARVFADGRLLLDGTSREPVRLGADTSWLASEELAADLEVVAGTPVALAVEYVHSGAPVGAFRVGARDVDEDALMAEAEDAAREADVAIVFVGTSHEYESEGHDRTSFSLPRRQDELVRRVAAVNPRTVVVVNAGCAVDLPWADDVAAVLQVWLGGQEMDGGIADVLVGDAEPGGRLPVTIPFRIEHDPSYGSFPGENGEVRYTEGLFVGYRGYENRALSPRYAFGHGLSYTSFQVEEPRLSDTTFVVGNQLRVQVPVANTGARSGSEVVQCYVAPRTPRLSRPLKELKGFAKLRLGAGESGMAEIVLDDRSFAYWDNGHPDYELLAAQVGSHVEVPPSSEGSQRGWRVDPGDYDILIGTASDRILHTCTVTVAA
jgi:beta-glucosidase